MGKQNRTREILIIVLTASILTFLIGFVALIGIIFNIPILTRGSQDYNPVSPNTAVCFMISGAALFLNAYMNDRTVSKILSIIIILTGALTLSEKIFGLRLYIDTWLFPNYSDVVINNPSKMAGVTAFNFIILGIALLYNRSKKASNLFLILITITFIDALIAIAGYVYDVSALYSLGSYYKLSFYTAAAFLILSTGILFLYEDTFIVKLFKSNGIGRVLILRFTPFIIILIIVTKILSALGSSAGYYTSNFGEALGMIGNIIIIAAFIIWNANKFQKLDDDLKNSLRQNQLLASIVESTTDAVVSKTLDGTITSWNEGSEKLYGYKREEIIGKPISIIIPSENMNDHKDIMEKVRHGKHVNYHETVRKKKDGGIVDISINLSPIKDSQGHIIGASSIARDITERKITQERLRHYTEKLQVLNRLMSIISSNLEIENIYDNFITELGQKILFDQASLIFLNEKKDEYMIDRMWSKFPVVIKPGQWKKVEGSIFGNVLKNNRPLIENEYKSNGRMKELNLFYEEGYNSLVIIPLKIKDEVIGFFTQFSKIPGAYNNDDVELLTSISEFLSIAIQNSKLYEKIKKMNEELEHRVMERTWELEEANHELEAFAYSVSHDLKAPLRAIDGFAKVLAEDYSGQLDIEALRILNVIIQNTQKMSNLINDLLTFSRASRSNVNMSKLNIKDIIHSSLAQLSTFTDEDNIDINIQKNIPQATGDKNMIQLVFVNLISNALKFSSTREKSIINIGAEEQGDEIVFCIEDNGVGFNMKYYDKLFGVFQRLHSDEEFDGTGVGLALVQKIIQKHGGKVWAESEEDKGAAFYFTLKKEREKINELQ